MLKRRLPPGTLSVYAPMSALTGPAPAEEERLSGLWQRNTDEETGTEHCALDAVYADKPVPGSVQHII